MTERELSEDVRTLADTLGLLAYHTYDSRRSEPGFPDWVIAGPRRVLFRELKTEAGRLTLSQVRWGEVLRSAGADYDVWRPSDWMSGRITREMKGTRYVQEGQQGTAACPRSGEAGEAGTAAG